MPVVGSASQAHSHFIPIVTDVVLTRVSLSQVYLYNSAAPANRVSLSQTYQYNLILRVTRSQIYKYDLNVGLPGPTRLYFHSALNPLSNLPTTERSTLTAIKNVDAQTVNRQMDRNIGTAQASLALTSNTTTSAQNYYFTRFVSEKLRSVSSIVANTWTYNFAAKASNPAANFPVSGTNQPVRVVAYIWRPSSSTNVGTIIDSNSASTVDEPAANTEQVCHTTFSGGQVLNVQDGDVLCFEVWFITTQLSATAFTDTFYYNGTTVNTTELATVSNHASFIETPQGLDFGEALTRVSLSRTYKYNGIARATQSSRYQYGILVPVVASTVYRYAIAIAVTLSRTYLYNIAFGRVSLSSVYKYNIAKPVIKSAVYRYALMSRLQLSRIYPYRIATAVTTSIVYKYNIILGAFRSQTYRYSIVRPVFLSRIYRYSLSSRLQVSKVYPYRIANFVTSSRIYRYSIALGASLSRTYRYQIVTPVVLSRIYRYAMNARASFGSDYLYRIATSVSLSRVYKYNLLTKALLSRIYRYSILTPVLRSRVYNYNILTKLSTASLYRYAMLARQSLPQIYRYNISQLFRLTKDSTYLYRLLARTSLAETYRYNIASKVSLSSQYPYRILKLASLSRIYRYGILTPVVLSRIYRYNLVKLVSLSRNYLYNMLALTSHPLISRYNIIVRLAVPKIYRYRIGEVVSKASQYLYNLIGRLRASRIYRYAISITATGVIWQLTDKPGDFPDSLENLVRDYVEANWYWVMDPKLSNNPRIITTSSPQNQAQLDNFPYDTYRSYYIRVKEVQSEVTNRQIRLNTYEFETPIELECFSRRLKKGEAFNELNNIMNELMRIFGTYDPNSTDNNIFGVQGITFDRISSMARERRLSHTIWARRMRIILHYYKVSTVG